MRHIVRRTVLRRLAVAALLFVLPAAALAAEAQTARLTAAEAQAVGRVENYLDGIETLRARFVQTSSNGGVAAGEVYLQRPGKVRFEYDPPHPALIVSEGTVVVYYDRELDQASYLPLSRTPLWFLLREDIDIDGEKDLKVAAVESRGGMLRLELRRSEVEDEAAGAVTLVFAEDPLELRKWRIVDAQGVTTEIALVDPERGVAIDPERFRFGAIDLPKPRTQPFR